MKQKRKIFYLLFTIDIIASYIVEELLFIPDLVTKKISARILLTNKKNWRPILRNYSSAFSLLCFHSFFGRAIELAARMAMPEYIPPVSSLFFTAIKTLI